MNLIVNAICTAARTFLVFLSGSRTAHYSEIIHLFIIARILFVFRSTLSKRECGIMNGNAVQVLCLGRYVCIAYSNYAFSFNYITNRQHVTNSCVSEKYLPKSIIHFPAVYSLPIQLKFSHLHSLVYREVGGS